jgi:transcriptional/translational regulatory protein YebC/TACO1
MVPQNYVKLESEEDIKNMEKLIEVLEDNDDVQHVYHNWDNED